jgi:hypothetical protein
VACIRVRQCAGTGRARGPGVAPVADAFEEQAGGRRGELRGQAGGRREELRDVGHLEIAASDRDEHADHATDHLPEEVRPLDPDEHQRAVFDDLDPRHLDVGRLFARVVVGEAGEIVKPLEGGRALPHAGHVDRLAHPPHEGLAEGRAAARDLVQVDTRDGVVPRVKAVGHRRERDDVDVGGQFVVDAPSQGLGGQRRAQVEVRDLPERVHARVGASRSVELERPWPSDLPNGPIDLALDRARVLLDLPAAVAGAGVFDEELEPGHVFSASPRV